MQVSAHIRYGMIADCLERLWGTPERPAGGGGGDALLYDGLLQQLEGRLLRLHRLMLDLGLSSLPPSSDPGTASPSTLGRVTYLPCQVRTPPAS